MASQNAEILEAMEDVLNQNPLIIKLLKAISRIPTKVLRNIYLFEVALH